MSAKTWLFLHQTLLDTQHKSNSLLVSLIDHWQNPRAAIIQSYCSDCSWTYRARQVFSSLTSTPTWGSKKKFYSQRQNRKCVWHWAEQWYCSAFIASTLTVYNEVLIVNSNSNNRHSLWGVHPISCLLLTLSSTSLSRILTNLMSSCTQTINVLVLFLQSCLAVPTSAYLHWKIHWPSTCPCQSGLSKTLVHKYVQRFNNNDKIKRIFVLFSLCQCLPTCLSNAFVYAKRLPQAISPKRGGHDLLGHILLGNAAWHCCFATSWPCCRNTAWGRRCLLLCFLLLSAHTSTHDHKQTVIFRAF